MVTQRTALSWAWEEAMRKGPWDRISLRGVQVPGLKHSPSSPRSNLTASTPQRRWTGTTGDGWARKSLSHVRLLATPLYPWNSPSQNTGVSSLSLLQGICPLQGSNPGLPHCRWIPYHLSHQGSPRTLEHIPSPVDLPQPRNRTGVSSIAGRFFAN